MDLLKIDSISKYYTNHKALDNVSLSVPKQSIYGLLGPNGAGKTTLIRIITQIFNADEGKVFLEDQAITQEDILKIGYLPEERGLYKKMKVAEQLLYLSRLKGMDKADAKARIKFWLDRLDLSKWWNKNVEDLSKGMQQKVQFMATVLHEPSLIILDEPFSGFDPVNTNIITQEILRLREQGTTVIFSTHRMESVEALCDHIALINKSKKILEGKKVDIKASHKNNAYTIWHEGRLSDSNEHLEILKQEPAKDNQNYFFSEVRCQNGYSSNELLKFLIEKTSVKHFEEKVPSINEIFINEVQKS